MSLRCGFIGLGSQGAPIARRMIHGGLPMVLWARRPESLEPYRSTSAQFASTPAELASQVDHVGVCVVNDADVQQVCEQLIPAMQPGGRIAIHSTVHPDTCRVLARQASMRGVALIDAPVSGGAPAAEAGALTVMVGGSAEAFAAAQPIFATFGRLIVHLGEVGAGQIAKLINNSLMAAQLGLADSAARIAQELGLDRKTLLELLSASSARSYALEVYARQTSLADFAHAATLLDKARLLREMLGPNSPTATVLWNAARPLCATLAQSAGGYAARSDS